MNAAVHDEDLTDLLHGDSAPARLPAAPAPVTPSAPINQPPVEDLGPTYEAHRSALEGRAALSSLLSQTQAQPAPDVPRGTAPQPAPTYDAALFRQRVGRDPSATELANFQQFQGAGWTGGTNPTGGIQPVLEDIGRGALEAPVHGIVQGARNALQSMVDGAADLGTWLEKTADLPGLKVDEHGVHVVSGEELQSLPRPLQGKELPNLGEPTTVTGGLVESAAQFVTSMASLGRVFGPMGADLEGTLGHLATAGKSAAALFAGFHKAEGNVADLIEQAPALSNPITRFLKSDPTDSQAWGRAKNAIAGLGLGELQNGVLASFKMLRGALTAKAQVSEFPETPGAAGTPEQGAPTPAAFKFLGDPDAKPDAPLAEVRQGQPDSAADKAARAQEAMGGLTPEGVAGLREPQVGTRAPIDTQYHVDEDEIHHVTSNNGETTAKVRGNQLQILSSETRGGVAEPAEPSSKWHVDGKPIWEMQPHELDEAVENIRKQDVETLKEAFGNEEDAGRFTKLADSNSDRAYAKAEKMVDALSPEKRAIVEKWERGGGPTLEEQQAGAKWTPPPSPEELKSLSRDVGEVSNAQTPEELTQFLKYAITKMGDSADPQKMNLDELSATMQLKEGYRLATEKGWNVDQISKDTIRAAAARFHDPEDAKFMLQRFLNPQLESETPTASPSSQGPTGTTFTTAKGSTYEVTGRGTTIRNKAARTDVGHEGDAGPQPESERTFYVTAEDAQKLGEFQSEGGPKKAIAVSEDGHAGIKYLEGKDEGKLEKRTVVPIHDEPAEGLTPVELWKDGTRAHFGNEITEVNKPAQGGASGASSGPTGAQGQGEGTARLARMADEAAARDLTLASDSKVSEAAAKVYDRLEKQGYPVTRNPAEADGEGNLLSTTTRPVFEVGPKPKPEGLASGEVPGTAGLGLKEPEVYINFARIDTPDDVKRTMAQLAQAQKDNIDIATRGIRSFEETKLGANFQDAWKTLMERRSGQPLNAEQQLAGRQLLAQSATKAEALTRLAVDSPTPENLFAWRKQLQTHAMIQAEVSGSQAEIARSLGAMRIPVSGEGAIDRMAAITTQLDQLGGMKSNMDFLTATKALMDSGQLEALGNVAEKTLYARTRDALITGWTNGLLTNPMTHVKVNLSNIGTIALRLCETRLAETMDTLTDHQGVPAGEAAQTTAGLISGIKDSFRYIGSLMRLTQAPESNPISDAVQAFKTGKYSVGEQTSETPDWSQEGQESGDALAIADSGWVGKATDMMSSVVTSPGRALAGEHEFYRSIGMRMELNRFAYRQGIRELNAGKIEEGDLAGRVAELVENPPKGLSTAAIDGMTYQTFTDAPGKLAEIIANLREAYPEARVVIPFYKIPARIMSFTFERSPLAPLMAGWRADIAAGGARQSMALAKTGLGSMIMLGASDAVLNGTITGMGPNDKGTRLAMENEGWQPYSLKLPNGRWVQYNRIETVGSSIALAADLTETVRDYHTAVNQDDPNVEKLTAAGIATLANNVTSKTYFEGLARFFETVSDPKSNAEAYLKSFAGSLVPAGVGAAARLMDPYSRATYDMMDAIKARTPGVSASLPPLRNLWGEPIRHDSGLGLAYDAFAPFATRRPGNEPIDQEILKQGMHFSLPAARTSFGGAMVDLSKNPQAYSRYVQLAGNALESPAWGMGAKDLMNAIVTGNHPLSTIYNMRSDGADGGKYVMLRDLMEQYRKQAKSQVLDEFQGLRDQVAAAHEKQTQLRMPVVQ